MTADEWALEGTSTAARELAEAEESVELFLYPGDRHLFADDSLADYDEKAAALLTERVLAFLGDVKSRGAPAEPAPLRGSIRA